MNDIRRTILWVIFGFSLIMLWDQWQIHNGEKPTFFPSPTKENVQQKPVQEGRQSVPEELAQQGNRADSTQILLEGKAAPLTGERFLATTDVLELSFDTQGGSLIKAELLNHKDLQEKQKNFILLDQAPERVYVAQTGLIGGGFANHKTAMKRVSSGESLKDGADEIVVRFESEEVGGLKLVKTYTAKRGSYVLTVAHEIVNTSTDALTPKLYLQLVRDGNKPPGESSFYSTFTGPVVYTEEKKYQKIDFSDIDKGKVELEKQTNNGYVAMVQHYFATAWLLGEGVSRELFVRKVDDNLYSVGMIEPLGELQPGEKKTTSARLYVGPQEEKKLEQLAPGLELVKDYGWLTILAKPLYWLLDKLHGLLQNWGWSIVALVLLLKIAFYWLNAKAYSSMAKMKAINPKITEMRERLKSNPQQMQQEMMRIYREEKVNPMGGCLPIMIQIPVFIALYWVLLSSVEMRNAPWIMWIQDLSANDPYYILPLLMTATTMLQTALNPAPPDPMQAKMMWLMPLMFSVMFFFFPAGLVLYWLTNNILSIAQQWLINTRMGVPPKFHLPKFR
ncbi:MAG: membrane protein insertase YidC [Hylemonella sp.]|nr:membrane protein insertase YidC [Hylemonella sp.]